MNAADAQRARRAANTRARDLAARGLVQEAAHELYAALHLQARRVAQLQRDEPGGAAADAAAVSLSRMCAALGEFANGNAGQLAVRREFKAARRLLLGALAVLRHGGLLASRPQLFAHTYSNLGGVWLKLGQPRRAAVYSRAALAMAVEFGAAADDVARWLTNLALALCAQGRHGAARRHLERSLQMLVGAHPAALLAFQPAATVPALGLMDRIAGELEHVDALERALQYRHEAADVAARLLPEHPLSGYLMQAVADAEARRRAAEAQRVWSVPVPRPESPCAPWRRPSIAGGAKRASPPQPLRAGLPYSLRDALEPATPTPAPTQEPPTTPRRPATRAGMRASPSPRAVRGRPATAGPAGPPGGRPATAPPAAAWARPEQDDPDDIDALDLRVPPLSVFMPGPDAVDAALFAKVPTLRRLQKHKPQQQQQQEDEAEDQDQDDDEDDDQHLRRVLPSLAYRLRALPVAHWPLLRTSRDPAATPALDDPIFGRADEDAYAAAARLQAAARGHATRQRLRREREAAASIQAAARGRAARAQLAREHDAAARVQALQRGRMARAERLRAKQLQQEREAATRVQALQRGRAARAQLAREHEAAVRIQAVARGRSARGERDQRRAAVRIQAAQRGRVARRERARREERRDAAARLQALQRGRAARARLEHERQAAVHIQAVQRGRAARRERRQEQAAARIQAVARGRAVRLEREQAHAAAVRLQAAERGRAARGEALRRKEARRRARAAAAEAEEQRKQAEARRERKRREAEARRRAAAEEQARRDEAERRAEARRQAAAAARIQAAARGRQSREHVRELRRRERERQQQQAAVRIQAAQRGFAVRRARRGDGEERARRDAAARALQRAVRRRVVGTHPDPAEFAAGVMVAEDPARKNQSGWYWGDQGLYLCHRGAADGAWTLVCGPFPNRTARWRHWDRCARRLQRVYRGFSGRESAFARRAARTHEQNQMVPMPGTVPGEAGWYMSRNGVYECAIVDGGDWRIVAGPLDKREWRKRVVLGRS